MGSTIIFFTNSIKEVTGFAVIGNPISEAIKRPKLYRLKKIKYGSDKLIKVLKLNSLKFTRIPLIRKNWGICIK